MWAKDIKIGNQAINARIETAATKPCFVVPGSHAAVSSRPRAFMNASVDVSGKTKPESFPFTFRAGMASL